MYIYINTYQGMSIYIYVYMCRYIYMCIYMCVYINVYVCIFIHYSYTDQLDSLSLCVPDYIFKLIFLSVYS